MKGKNEKKIAKKRKIEKKRKESRSHAKRRYAIKEEKEVGGFPLLPIRENEIVGADFCIGVHEQNIGHAGLLDQIIPCGGSSYVFGESQMRAVGQELDHFVALHDAFDGRSVVGHEDFVVEFRFSILCLQFLALLLHIGHQTQAIDVVSGNKDRDHKNNLPDNKKCTHCSMSEACTFYNGVGACQSIHAPIDRDASILERHTVRVWLPAPRSW